MPSFKVDGSWEIGYNLQRVAGWSRGSSLGS
jgi:hypothetical protein